MRYSGQPSRGYSWLTWLLMAFVMLLVGGSATAGALYAFGILNFQQHRPTVQAGPPPGTVPIVLSIAPIPAYTTITREHLYDPKTNQPQLLYVKAEDADKSGMLTRLDQIVGRVLSRDKAKGYAFSERDFAPKGTRGGIVAGIPPGKLAIALDVKNIQGVVYGLRMGDRFDLIATGEIDLQKQMVEPGPSKPAPGSVDPKKLIPSGKQSSVQLLVHYGVVLVPVQPPDSKKPAPRSSGRTRPEQEIVVAIDPEEVTKITRALGSDQEIICVAHSGQPKTEEQEPERPIPEVEPKVPVLAGVETFVGGKRETVFFSGSPEGK